MKMYICRRKSMSDKREGGQTGEETVVWVEMNRWCVTDLYVVNEVVQMSRYVYCNVVDLEKQYGEVVNKVYEEVNKEQRERVVIDGQ